MTYLITGAAGFIGSALAKRLLARGEEVVGIDNLNDYYPVQLKKDRLEDIGRNHPKGFKFIQLDFAEMVQLRASLSPLRIEHVVHLGAQAGVRYSLTNPFAYTQSNLVGHLNMLEYCRYNDNCRQMVYASSSSVYGANKKRPFSVDDRVDHPVSLYAATKKADELMSEAYSHLYRLPQTGLRFFTVYGPWGRPDMAYWSFTKAILAGEPIKVFNHGDMQRDFTYIDDIISGVMSCIDHPATDDGAVKPGRSRGPHRIYNIGNNTPEPLLGMIATLEKALGIPARRELLPMQDGDVPSTFADISDIQRDLGFKPTTSIEVGLPRFVDWYRKYHGV
ncbi:MAG: NAD-dependent epimerase/dehydratase family protein [Alphaproteobacteria bacterium]